MLPCRGEYLRTEEALDRLASGLIGLPHPGDLGGRQMLVEQHLLEPSTQRLRTPDLEDHAIGINETVGPIRRTDRLLGDRPIAVLSAGRLRRGREPDVGAPGDSGTDCTARSR